jgi:hypothetical protein
MQWCNVDFFDELSKIGYKKKSKSIFTKTDKIFT